jgi:hypothetical protein
LVYKTPRTTLIIKLKSYIWYLCQTHFDVKKINIPDSVIGLTDIEVKASREKFGNNEQIHKQNTDGG